MTTTRTSEYQELYDDIAPGYYDRVYAEGKGVQWFWHHYRFLAVDEALPASGGESILDMGCGPGTFLGRFGARWQRAQGIDLAKGQIEFASQKYGSERLRFDAIDVAEFKHDNVFDAITSIEVIEHLPASETQSFLRTIHRLLKPGGTLVLTTPNYRSFWPLIEWLISKKGPVNYLEQHITHFNVPRLVRALEEAGFQVQKKRTFFVIAPFLAGISTKLAEVVYALERKLLPGLGSEIVISARKP
jgi:2-polyprenyl-3-methyl-5-hydroxy-6-metoxy-1,4-benzoquinol methylase